jgi:hypothetical protein
MSRASAAMTSSAVDATVNIDAVGRDREIPHLGSHQRDCTCRPGVDELGRRLACHAGAIVAAASVRGRTTPHRSLRSPASAAQQYGFRGYTEVVKCIHVPLLCQPTRHVCRVG